MKMNKLISLLLVVCMLGSMGTAVFATTDYTHGTQVVYTATGSESYTITVPAQLAPGGNGIVTLKGTWADNRIVTVTADATVLLKNSIKETDTKTLTVTFAGIEEAGNNERSQTFVEPVKISDISDALFGTWSGHFEYQVGIEDAPTLEGDGQTYHKMAPSTLTFRSTAPLHEFQEVKVNGETLPESAYTLTEGSTIVTLNIDYLETLDVDDYKITVVSDSGSPSANFGVVTTELNEYSFYYNQPYSAYIEAYDSIFAFVLTENGEAHVCVSGGSDSGSYTVVENQLLITTESLGTNTLTITDNSKELYYNDLSVMFTINNDVVMADDYIYFYRDDVNGYVASVIDKTKYGYSEIKSNINGIPLVGVSNSMFANNVNLATLPQLPADWMFPNNHVAWGECMFEGCTNLKEAILPSSFTQLPFGCFLGCTNLEKVKIPATLTGVGYDVFKDCTSLKTIIFDGTIEQWNFFSEFKYFQNSHIFDNVPATEVICSDGIVSLVE